ncbi:hypothetical protein AVEN_196879-1 [Araneus ventricosus]|uniref:Uncharacterized protein n=1 Tax=Araneus ventricosus TaxID=182803 RepID=A0A4Y2ECV4_ARAVE|nr:hypothetical protein AVEN_196879-1 [Araneus ventricosus]
MYRPKLVKPFGAIYFLPLANAKRWCMPTYQATTSRKMSPQQCKRRRAMFGRCLAYDVLLPGLVISRYKTELDNFDGLLWIKSFMSWWDFKRLFDIGAKYGKLLSLVNIE